MKIKQSFKETSSQRIERIHLSKSTTTKVVKDKSKYSRNEKHKGSQDPFFYKLIYEVQ